MPGPGWSALRFGGSAWGPWVSLWVAIWCTKVATRGQQGPQGVPRTPLVRKHQCKHRTELFTTQIVYPANTHKSLVGQLRLVNWLMALVLETTSRPENHKPAFPCSSCKTYYENPMNFSHMFEAYLGIWALPWASGGHHEDVDGNLNTRMLLMFLIFLTASLFGVTTFSPQKQKCR